MLNYVGCLQGKNKSKAVINEYLRCLGHYYEFSKLANITIGVRIKGESREKSALLKAEELDKIYNDFIPENDSKYVDCGRLILELIVYQALERGDLFRLRLEDVDLEKGMIRISGGLKRRNDRVLNLKCHQVIPLHEYINKHHYNLNDKLFSFCCLRYSRLRDLLTDLLKKIQVKKKNLKNFNVIRQSRYAIWIKQHGLRKAQYLAGFKHPSSIQVCQDQDLQDLKQVVLRWHPLN